MSSDTQLEALQPAHAAPIEAVAAQVGVNITTGLSDQESERRLVEHGPNELEARRRPGLAHLLWEALREPFILVLLAAGLLAVALGEVRDGVLVLLGLIPIVGADVVTEYRAERALETLRASAAPVARVRRAGSVRDLPAAELVAGDIVLLGTGDVVSADIRLLIVEGLMLDRAVLTGESLPGPGRSEPDDAATPLAERRSMAYSGTSVVQGRGEGIVVATGPRTELGRIAGSLGVHRRRRSPIQFELGRLVRILLTVAVGLVAVTSGLALARGEPLGVALLAGIAAAIAAIPEEPPVMLAVILGLGAFRLLRRRVLVRRLNAQETLSAVDLILTDKTGTLTLNRLSLAAALTRNGPLNGDQLREVVELALRTQDDAWYQGKGARLGSFGGALERTLVDAGEDPDFDLDALREVEPSIDGRPYARARWHANGEIVEAWLGAHEVVLGLTSDSEVSRNSWRALADGQAEEGRRLLLLAARAGDRPARPRAVLVFADPLREDVSDALAMASRAGIQTLMVTGDHPRTARRVADAAGLPSGLVITGSELAEWSETRLAEELPRLRIVARAVPEMKLRLVDAARRADRTVAVTGDGVNDAPALHNADIGVAMGSGTAVAREASDLVLGDDSFTTLMQGLREGRRMVSNIQKGLVFLISTHVALLGFILVATVYGFSQPLLPIQILWLELFIDVSASIAFEREPEEPGQMRTPPRKRGEALLTAGILGRISLAGAWTAFAALIVMVGHDGSLEEARWLAFNVLVAGQLVRAYANRSLTQPILRLATNRVLLAACFIALAVQLAIPYVAPLAEAFRATPLSLEEWMLVAAIAVAPALVAETIRGARGRLWIA